jgi:hypothetical protein
VRDNPCHNLIGDPKAAHPCIETIVAVSVTDDPKVNTIVVRSGRTICNDDAWNCSVRTWTLIMQPLSDLRPPARAAERLHRLQVGQPWRDALCPARLDEQDA